MKKTTLLYTALLTLLSSARIQAQSPFSTSENLDINLLKVAHMVHGDMWYNLTSGTAACEYPKGSGKHASYASGLWISGLDHLGNIRTATSTFRTIGFDYMPGPLDASDTISVANSSNWAKIWKVEATNIHDFILLYKSGGVSAVSSSKFDIIKQWPATGNIYAIGASGSSLPELLAPSIDAQYFAPFVDVNGDGIYNWKDGDYPKIKGDQMLWWVINDNGKPHTLSKSEAMKLEVHIAAYAYNRGSSVDRMLFYEYTVHNKSDEDYTNFRLGKWTDDDLGNPFDDLIGIDSTYRMGVTFQETIDGPNSLSSLNSYDKNPPITGLSIVEMPGDIYPIAMQKLGSITTYVNVLSGPISNPIDKTQYSNYMNGKGASGIDINLKYGTNILFFDMNQRPCDSVSFHLPPLDDRRFIISSIGYNFPKNTSAKWGMIFMVTDTNNHICPSLNYNEMSTLADTAWKIYWNPLPPLSTKELAIASTNFKLYPNPAKNVLYVNTSNSNKQEQLRIVDALGKTINLPTSHNGNIYEISISGLAAGIYSVVYFDGTTITTQRFVKE